MTEETLPQQVKDRYEKASMAVNKKNYDYAIELLIQVINIKPDFAKGRQLLSLAEIKNFEKTAPNIISRVITRILSSFTVLIAMVNETKGDYHAAMSVYENILRKDPKNVGVLIKLGSLLKTKGMKKAAAVTLESAVSISVKNIIAHELLGELYSDLGNYDRARFCFKKVLELRPHDANAERGLKNLDALTTIEESFEAKEGGDFRIREIKE